MAVTTSPYTIATGPMTSETLARAVAARRIRVIRGFVLKVYVAGQDIGAEIPRAKADDITYEIITPGEPGNMVAPGPLVPSSRRHHRSRIVGSPVGYPVEITIAEDKAYLHVHEVLDLYGCDKQPVEATI